MEQALASIDAPVFDRLRELCAEVLELDAAQVVPEAHFADDLGADSLDLVELVEAIEEAFGISVDDEELAEVTTVAEAVALVEAKLRR